MRTQCAYIPKSSLTLGTPGGVSVLHYYVVAQPHSVLVVPVLVAVDKLSDLLASIFRAIDHQSGH